MADAGLQAPPGQDEKGSLRPEMEITLYSRWFWVEGAPGKVVFCRLSVFFGGRCHQKALKSIAKLRALPHISSVPRRLSVFRDTSFGGPESSPFTRVCLTMQTIIAPEELAPLYGKPGEPAIVKEADHVPPATVHWSRPPLSWR
jgi:hypothetical protein